MTNKETVAVRRGRLQKERAVAKEGGCKRRVVVGAARHSFL
jgi:hypothetical protein